MQTQKLYEEDGYLRTFQATVLSCEPQKEYWSVALNRTAFYPEGGGQPGDCGVLNCVNVLDTKEKAGVVYHLTDAPLPVGSRVTGGINWPRRFSHMQEHTGEHILTGVLHRFFGVNNVGFHMGSACVTLDLDKPLDAHQIALGERLANRAVYENLPVKVSYPSPEQLKRLDYRSKKALSGRVRIVSIPGYDVCACCGTHVAHTGEIGLIKVQGFSHYKGGVRISLLCGQRALRDYGRRLETIETLCGCLSAKPESVVGAVHRLLQDKEDLRQALTRTQNALFSAKAQTAKASENGLLLTFEDELEPDALRRYSLLLAPHCKWAAAVFSQKGDRFQYAVAGAPGVDVRAFGKAMNTALQGRGGGKSALVQGSVQASRQEIVQWFSKQERGKES